AILQYKKGFFSIVFLKENENLDVTKTLQVPRVSCKKKYQRLTFLNNDISFILLHNIYLFQKFFFLCSKSDSIENNIFFRQHLLKL
ncbi:hypothetical protein DD595_26515, partial [Enterobacter cloacae complex sp. 4DZ3-17B2]